MEDTFLVDLAQFDLDVALLNILFRKFQSLLGPPLVLSLVGEASDALYNEDNVAALLVHSDFESGAIQHKLHNTCQPLLVFQEAKDGFGFGDIDLVFSLLTACNIVEDWHTDWLAIQAFLLFLGLLVCYLELIEVFGKLIFGSWHLDGDKTFLEKGCSDVFAIFEDSGEHEVLLLSLIVFLDWDVFGELNIHFDLPANSPFPESFLRLKSKRLAQSRRLNIGQINPHCLILL